MNASSRAVALEVVRRVADEGAYSNLLLPSLVSRSGLAERDRALATELGYGTLRRLIPIDHALGALVDLPLASASPRARAALRVGAYQLLFTRVPPHAAVSETVALLAGNERGFANAVLRRLAREGLPEPPPGDEGVAVRTGLAAWAVRELRLLLGDEAEPAGGQRPQPGERLDHLA